MNRLKGKVAVVTGASKGIGAAIAERLGAEGASVVVNYARSKQDAETVAKKVEGSGGKAVVVQGDLARHEDVKRVFAETRKAFGRVDVLVNNAGVYEFRPLEQVDGDHYHRQFDLNVLGLLHATQEAVKLMGQEGGSVINISSVAAKTPPASGSVYSATKAAVDAITRSLAQELGSRKIRVNSLQPGFTETEGLRASESSSNGFREYAVSRTPLGRVGQAEDVAKVAVFLASDDSAWITGEQIQVGGGIRL